MKFNGKGLTTKTGARMRLKKIEHLLTGSVTMVAVQGDGNDTRFYPVVVLNDRDAQFAFEIASHGVVAVKV